MLLISFLLIILIIVALVVSGVNRNRKPELTSDVTFERVEYMSGSKL